jgi:hypothetical protein
MFLLTVCTTSAHAFDFGFLSKLKNIPSKIHERFTHTPTPSAAPRLNDPTGLPPLSTGEQVFNANSQMFSIHSRTNRKTIDNSFDPLAEPSAANFNDVTRYKDLRARALTGDIRSMIELNELIKAASIKNTGEPYQLFWLVQAVSRSALNGEKSLIPADELRSVCTIRAAERRNDFWFESACSVRLNEKNAEAGALPWLNGKQ